MRVPGCCLYTYTTLFRVEDPTSHETEYHSNTHHHPVSSFPGCASVPGFSHCHVHPCAISAGGLWTTIKISIIKLFSRKPELHWSALVWFLAAAVADVLITVTLVINLVCNEVWTKTRVNIHDRQSKRKTGFAATNDAISKITRSESCLNLRINIAHFGTVTVQTCMLT